MLYDPKWEGPSLLGLIRWLEQRPPETRYSFIDAENCLVGQYLGRSLHSRELDRVFPGLMTIAGSGEWTFGAALERARSLMAGR